MPEPNTEAENEAITFSGSSFLSSRQLATKFNQQFNTSKLGSHTFSRETRVVTRDTKRKPLERARKFTADLVKEAIKSCRNNKAFVPNKLSIFHLKHLGPRAIEYITLLFKLSVTTCQIPSIWKSSLITPIPKPGKDTTQGTSYRSISLLYSAAKVLEFLLLPTINKYLLPAQDQHGYRPEHSTTSALLQLTTNIAMGFNQRRPQIERYAWLLIYRLRSIQFTITTCYQRSTDLSSIHGAMALMLSKRYTRQDLFQRCILNV